ncbi:hypothetical protein Q5752_006421 [Cryptotrichosporon argae]
MQTTDTGLLFQSTQQLADAASHQRKVVAARDVGRPIACSSKVLDMTVVGDDAFTAESGWQARRINLATGKTTKLYKGHKGPVTAIAVARFERLLLFTGSWDKTIRVWDADSGDLLQTLQGHTDFIKSLMILPTRRLLSTSSDRSCRVEAARPSMDNTARFLPTKGSSLTLTHPAYVKSLHSLPGGRHVLTGSSDEDIRVWDISDEPDLMSTVQGHCGEVTAIASRLCSGQVEVVTASVDGTVRRWAMDGELDRE